MIFNGVGDFVHIYCTYLISVRPPMKYTLFIINKQFFYANFTNTFLINSVPNEKPTKFIKWPLKLAIISSAKY